MSPVPAPRLATLPTILEELTMVTAGLDSLKEKLHMLFNRLGGYYDPPPPPLAAPTNSILDNIMEQITHLTTVARDINEVYNGIETQLFSEAPF